MSDDHRRDPTTGQRVARDVADFGNDSTLGMPTATPDLIATGLAQIEAQRAAESQRDPARGHTPPFDPYGATHDHHSRPPDGTLDLPMSDQVAPADEFAPGKAIGHFVIRARLGEGGMGLVLSGYDADLGRPVAIKVVKTSAGDHPAYRDRLLREARVMARLEHPNVVRVYEVGSERGRLFVAMELVDGVTLTNWLKVQRRRWREIVAMFEQVGRGLAAVHAAGLVHRDFKPDNVLVDRDGRARVADFGLARVDPDRGTVTPELAASLTRTGMLVGTPAYMAPEQHFGGNVDARADQYSFCVALREALIGRRPLKIEDKDWGDVPKPMRAAIDRGAAIDSAERFESIEALLEAIARAHNRRGLYIGAAAGALVVAGGIVAAIAATPSSEEPSATTPVAVAVDAAIVTPAEVSPVDATVVAKIVPPPADAAANIDPPPADAAASAKAAAKPKPAVADKPATRTATSPTGETLVTEMKPVAATAAAQQHNEQGNEKPKHEMIAAHRVAVRAALEDFGFGGITVTGSDRDADLAELEAQLAAATDDFQRGGLLYGMGQTERMMGNCIGAAKHWRDAKKALVEFTKGPIDTAERRDKRTVAFKFYGRVVIAEGFCELIGGHALGVDEQIVSGIRNLFGAADGERAEAWFAMGIADWETGDEENGKRLLIQAAQHGSEKLRAAIDTYAKAVGVKF